ncbi:helix-turn-helix domain-containing protein [Paractinoplanes maris]|uniref:helix-turn-helix domain-containing protein n=1 Tax=Paractinoplanes maris TaxID=1734446 RepID=UPI0020207139|nr:helix-turn-helix transcriptional regulator [Actinoplanes maris]
MHGDNEFGHFVRARRGRIPPQQVGLTPSGRRRVPGLRREELARIAGVSPRYLTRLEQGQDRNPSPQVLRALATALRLNADETAHLCALAAPPPLVTGHDEVSDVVQRLLDAWTNVPAYVRNRRFDVLAANKSAMALSTLYTPGGNLVRGVFLDPAVRTLFPDWTEVAAQTAAALRAEGTSHDPRTAELVSSMLADSDFRAMWEAHDVRPVRDAIKRFDHPIVGSLTLRREALSIAGGIDRVIITYQADPGTPSVDALARLH